jgi:hypothetical protein
MDLKLITHVCKLLIWNESRNWLRKTEIGIFVSESEIGCFFERVFLVWAERGAAASGEDQNRPREKKHRFRSKYEQYFLFPINEHRKYKSKSKLERTESHLKSTTTHYRWMHQQNHSSNNSTNKILNKICLIKSPTNHPDRQDQWCCKCNSGHQKSPQSCAANFAAEAPREAVRRALLGGRGDS